MPLDQATQKHRGFAFITYFEKEDAAAAMDNMHNGELYGRVLTVNFAQPQKIKGGEQGWASQAGMERCISWSLSCLISTEYLQVVVRVKFTSILLWVSV